MNTPDPLATELSPDAVPPPPLPPVPSRPWTLAVALAKWVATIVGLMLVPQIGYVAWLMIASRGAMPPMTDLIPPWWLLLGPAVPALLLTRHAWRDDASQLAVAPLRQLGWLLLPLASSLAIGALGTALGAQREAMMVDLGTQLARRPDWAVVGAVVAFGPLLEEAIFRGLAWRWLRPACGRWVTIGLSSLVFIGLHAGQYGAFGLASVAGLALSLAAIRERTGSLLLCMAAHMLVNAVAIAGAIAG